MPTLTYTEIKRHTAISNVRFDGPGVDRLIGQLKLSEAAIARATQRALRKLGQWMLRKVQREVSTTKQIALNVLRRRFRVYSDSRVRTGLFVKAWFGTRPIPADRLGTPRQTRTGVRVGKHSFAHAFLATMYNVGERAKQKGVWQRVGDERFPIFKPKVAIDDDVRAALRGLEPELEARFVTIFRQEINYENIKAQDRALRFA